MMAIFCGMQDGASVMLELSGMTAEDAGAART